MPSCVKDSLRTFRGDVSNRQYLPYVRNCGAVRLLLGDTSKWTHVEKQRADERQMERQYHYTRGYSDILAGGGGRQAGTI